MKEKEYLEDAEICGNCQHFHYHYVPMLNTYYNRQYVPIQEGHCSCQRLRRRRDCDKACPYFERLPRAAARNKKSLSGES